MHDVTGCDKSVYKRCVYIWGSVLQPVVQQVVANYNPASHTTSISKRNGDYRLQNFFINDIIKTFFFFRILFWDVHENNERAI